MMYDYMSHFSLSDAMLPLLVVWLSVFAEKLIPISTSVDPLTFFGFVCKRMAKKVLGQQYSPQQLLISGSLALIILVSPIAIIVHLLHAFASYQWLFDTLLLWVLLQFNQDAKIISAALKAVKEDKKQLAKDLLQQKLLRNTQVLSPLGLCKAGVESLTLRYHHQQFTTIICYLALGPTAALCYRLCYQAQQIWNLKLQAYFVFGRLANAITLAFQFVPSVIFNMSFVLTSSPRILFKLLTHKLFWRMLSASLFERNNQGGLLLSLAYALNISVGGPVMYDGYKQQRPRFTTQSSSPIISPHSQEPIPDTINTLISLLNRHLLVTLVVVTWISYWFFSS